MKNKTPFKHIWYIRETVTNGHDVYPVGFYFVDEAQILNGPYDTLETAKHALNDHIKIYF